MKGGSRKGEINQNLPERRAQVRELPEILHTCDSVLIWKADDHGGENRHASGFQVLGRAQSSSCPSSFFVSRPCALEGGPDDIESHLSDFIGRELGQTPHAPKPHDRGWAAAFRARSRGIPWRVFMDEKIFVDDDETAQMLSPASRALRSMNADRFIELPAAYDEGDVFALEKVGGADKSRTRWGNRAPGDVRHFRASEDRNRPAAIRWGRRGGG